MNHSKLLVVFFATCFLSAKSHAQTYFPAESTSPTLISAPLKEDSVEWKKEIKAIIKLQKNADKKEVEQALLERRFDAEKFVHFFDEELILQKYPKLYLLLDRSSATSRAVTDHVKNFYKTQRPYQVDKNIKELIEGHTNPSYPSGHTCKSYVLAHILAMLIPERRDEFYNRAEKIAQHRVLVGMHFQQDIKGGRELALLIVGGLLQNEDFQKDFAKAKVELGEKK